MIPECHHIKTSGGKCGSPALRGQLNCYFHSRPKQRAKQPHTYPFLPLSKDLANLPANLKDRGAIHHALTGVAKAIAEKRIEPRRAGLILYALQIAAGNAKKAEQTVASEAIAKPTPR